MTVAAAPPPAADARPDARAYRNVAALFAAQALLSPQLMIHIIFGPLAGAMLAAEQGASQGWATTPIFAMVVTSMFASAPASMLMGRIGRRPGLLIGVAFGAAGGALGAYAILSGSFALFLVASAFLGVYQSHQQLFRFAATDTCPDAFKPTAIGWVLGGGLIAALIGPALAANTKDLLAPVPIAGAYAALVVVNLVGAVPLLMLDIPRPPRRAPGAAPKRRLRDILANPRTRVAILCGMVSYALMTLVMTSASTAVVGCGYGEAMAANVIGAHVFAMFAPSFVTGALIRRFGHVAIIALGLVLLAICGVVAMSGIEIEKFFIALILLGLGWNFGFIGSTSLLASSHAPEDRAVIQGFNDFCVFGLVAVAALSSGQLMHLIGWSAVNLAMAPFLALAAAALIWLSVIEPKGAPKGA